MSEPTAQIGEGSYLSTRDMTMLKVESILRLQAERWGLEHDRQHTVYDWQGLLLERVGRLPSDPDQYLILAALAISAWEAKP